jgi:hypothetical protein
MSNGDTKRQGGWKTWLIRGGIGLAVLAAFVLLAGQF